MSEDNSMRSGKSNFRGESGKRRAAAPLRANSSPWSGGREVTADHTRRASSGPTKGGVNERPSASIPDSIYGGKRGSRGHQNEHE